MNSAHKKSGFKVSYLAIFGLTVTVSILVAYNFHTARQVIRDYAPLIHSSDEIQKSMANSHLLLEEILSGDEGESHEQVHSELADAKSYLSGLLSDDENTRPTIISRDRQTQNLLAEMQTDLNALADITKTRLRNIARSGPGSAIDQRYDEIYERLSLRTMELENIIDTDINEELRNIETTQVLIAAICITLALAIGLLIYILDRRQRNTLFELTVANDRLQQDQDTLQAMTEALEQHKVLLENTVEERTRELSIALQNAEISSEAKSDFLSSMSHELRTPLNAIIGFSQLLQLDSDSFSADEKNHIDEILDAGKHLLSLVNDILDLSAIEAGKLELSVEPIKVNETLSECLHMLQAVADENKISLNHRPDSNEDIVIMADHRRFRQIMLNLLSNAIKYNHEQGSVTLHTRTQSGSNIKIMVEDTGEGIEESRQPLVFESFERVSQNKAAISGTGIGLVLTKKMVEAMHGNIGFESTRGKGSTFWVELPLKQVRAA